MTNQGGMQEPLPGPSSQVWEQDVSVGGEDVRGEPAPMAVAVAPQGIATTRVVPSINAAANSVTVPVGECKRVMGKTPQRRRVTLIAFTAVPPGAYGALVGRANVDEQAALNNGLILPQAVPVPLSSSGEIWVANLDSDPMIVTYWAEIDPG